MSGAAVGWLGVSLRRRPRCLLDQTHVFLNSERPAFYGPRNSTRILNRIFTVEGPMVDDTRWNEAICASVWLSASIDQQYCACLICQ